MSHQDHKQSALGILARCAIITLSDTRTPDTDLSGRMIRQLLTENSHSITDYQLIPDEPEQLKISLNSLIQRPDVDLIITTGGTGFSPRDRTIDTIWQLFDKPIPGFGELFRMLSYQEIGSAAMLSRAAAGIIQSKPLFCLPGSTRAVQLAMTHLILPELSHLLGQLRKS